MDCAHEVARVIVSAAQEHGFIGTELATIEALAAVEKDLFMKMFSALDKHQKEQSEPELTVDEMSSMFSFVYAKAAEAVTYYVNNQEQKFDTLGLFDGKIPFCTDDLLIDHLKKLDAAAVLGGVFADWAESRRGEDGFHALLALFEALKWTFRVSVDLSIRFAEAKGRARAREK